MAESAARLNYYLKECLGKVEIRPSKGKGKGVFALKSIKAGERVTLYPAHALFEIEGEEDGKTRTKLIVKHRDADIEGRDRVTRDL